MRLTLKPENQDEQLQKVFQKETVTFKELSFQKKLEYIWDYYKWKIISVVALIIVLCTVIPSVIENNKEAALYAAFINTQMTDEKDPQILTDYAEQKQIDMDNKRMELDCSMIIKHKNPDRISMYSSQKLLAMFASDTLDVVVSDQDTCVKYAAMGVYADLEEILDKDFLEKHKDLLVYTDGQGEAGSHAYGIDVTDSPILKEEKAFLVPAVCSICVDASQPENSIKFLEYLLGE